MKSFKIVSSAYVTKFVKNDDTPLDWNKCIFCQEDSSAKLTCPADFTDRFKGAGYRTIIDWKRYQLSMNSGVCHHM